MTRMLASVSTPEEAEIVLAGGADIIDLPGAMSTDAIHATVAAIGGRRPVSATMEQPPAPGDPMTQAIIQICATGVSYLGVHIPQDADGFAAVAGLPGLASRVKFIAVFDAETPPARSRLPLLGRSGYACAMINTGANRRLLDHFDMPTLSAFLESCRGAGLLGGLAGSLETPDIPRLLVLEPDLLGFGNALHGAAEVDPARVRAVRGLIPQEHPVAETDDVDYRLLAGRFYAPPSESLPVDLVFVEDLVLPVFIGAYARERDKPQNVRFAVTASVMRTGRTAEDMRDVFSYDLITDGIRLLTGSGHVALVETLAERIAAMVLGHPRVTKVVVRVQKLETGSGVVGVEIERTRRAVRALDERPVVPLLADTPKGAAATKP